MKPVYLKMKSFGSYRDETIDFADVNSGIFLITGDTGAGKTTIFDAVMFALYGESSGGKRDGKMMVSQYAGPAEYTEVEFCFSCGPDSYTVRRLPEQPKYKKKAKTDGEIPGAWEYEELKKPRQPEVMLTLPDGKIFDGKIKETNEKIKEIVGVDAPQFAQIAMLAQGDFLKLLHARSDERKEIFAKLFDTCFYGAVEKELEARWRALYGELEDNRKEIEIQLSNIGCAADSAFLGAWEEQGNFGEERADELLRLIDDINNELLVRGEKKQQEAECCSRKLEEIRRKMDEAAAVNRDFDALDAEKRTEEALAAQKAETDEKRERIAKGERAVRVSGAYVRCREKRQSLAKKREEREKTGLRVEEQQKRLDAYVREREAVCARYDSDGPRLAEESAQLGGALERYDAAAGAQGIFEEKQTELAEKRNALDAERARWENAKKREAELSEEVKRLSELAGTKDAKAREADRLEREAADRQELFTLLKAAEGLAEEISERQRRYDAAEETRRQAEEAYSRLYQAFFDGQAQALRSRLVEGEPCPVCGSVHHAVLPQTTAPAVGKEEVDAAKKTFDRQAKAAQGEKEALTELCLRREENKKQLSVYRKRPDICDGSASAFEALAQVRQTEARLLALRAESETAAAAAETLAAKTEELSACSGHCARIGETVQRLALEAERLTAEAAAKKAAWEALLRELPFPTKEEAARQLEKLTAARQKLEEDKRNADETCTQAEQKLIALTAQLEAETRACGDLAGEERESRKDFAEALAENGFADEAEFAGARMTDEMLTQLRAEVSEYERQAHENRTKLFMLAERTEGRVRVDVSGFKEEREQCAGELERLGREDKELFSRRQANETARRKTAEGYRRRRELRARYTVIETLRDTAGGKLSRKRIDFQTYIQRRYFGQVISAANERLVKMSANQFILRCRELSNLGTVGNVGLDLDIYDIANDRIRDVKTLSGGESFMAALSMALGLSDVIQRRAGKIRIDTMFIDEGFGTLSDDTRNQALSLLADLSEGDRLIGIISHVTELKAQVEKKLVVTKTDEGSSARWQ